MRSSNILDSPGFVVYDCSRTLFLIKAGDGATGYLRETSDYLILACMELIIQQA